MSHRYNAQDLVVGVNALILHFGALGQRLTNVIYTNNELDPWHFNGMQDVFDINATVINIPCKLTNNNALIVCHQSVKKIHANNKCIFIYLVHGRSAELGSGQIWDPIDLVYAKNEIERIILDWLF